MEISIARKKIKKFSNKKFRKAQFNIFRATMSKKMKVSKDMFSVPGVKEYFRKEFLDKRIRFDPKLKDDDVRTITRNLSDIWCAYCTQTNNCPCIKIYCFIVNC
ncbi:uncharacterized protein LOC127881345 [Dreissena polymorpha]|uniref:uncharacterized protein LOC127881345 n=1 Tax=Dreissena polymorpha TaxID=45954 RepID=UPI0022643AE9|nr:uncharacterized protein LOC127881345 [Dreissena polymorpha]